MPRAASHIDRSELPEAQRLVLLERDVQEIRLDVADILSGEQRRDDRLKTDTQSSISSAAAMMTTQGAMLKEHDTILKELRDNSRASAEERVKRVVHEKSTARRDRRLTLALAAPIIVAAIYAIASMAGHPVAVQPPAHEEKRAAE
jgi:hypothetical protein